MLQHGLGLMAGAGMVMGFLGLTYGVGLGHTMAAVVTLLSGIVLVLAAVFRRKGIT